MSRHNEFHLDLLEFRDAMEGISAYYAALRSTPADKAVLIQRFEELDGGFVGADPAQEAKLDAAFHLAIAEAAHNVLLLHTIRGIFICWNRASWITWPTCSPNPTRVPS